MTIWRVRVRDQHAADHDVVIDAEPSTRTSDVIDELREIGFRSGPYYVGGGDVLHNAETLADAGLRHGDVISTGTPTAVDRCDAGPAVVIVAGPDAGRRADIDANGVVIGRSDDCDLTLDDEVLSARHCRVAYADGQVTIDDLGSTNGTYVEGELIDGPRIVEPGSYFQAGSSVAMVDVVAAGDLAVLGDEVPEVAFPRQYRHAYEDLPKKLSAPNEPSGGGAAIGMSWWRALVPLVTGVGFAAVTGRWIFLGIMVISPLVIAFEAFRRKRRRERHAAESQEQYERDLAAYEERAVQLRAVELARRREIRWCGGSAISRALVRHRKLWERAPSDDDFLSVAVGLAPLPSAIEAPDPSDRLQSVIWGTPIETHLAGTGSLSIVGDPGHGRATARAAVLTLAATHAPSELKVWVLADDPTGAEWGFVRWLPHAVAGDQTCLIGATPTARTEMIERIRQIVDTRAEAESDEMPLPAHLVVIDGMHHVDGADLTDLLRRGPGARVVALTIDEKLAPEGAGATLALGEAADLAVFDSRHQPRCENIVVPEVAVDVAEAAALTLAPLRSVGDERADGGVCHLVDIDHLSGLDGEHLVDRWRTTSPHLVATVGMAGDLPMHIDLARDGPHGLVGGTSGSGKTEFLKTLFVSLCVNNHPDDLAIVVVDFKGGVDHDAIRPLPHVVDVATNLDIAQFERTLRLLDAEQKRRQALLSAAGANNVDSYRLVRAERPDLPPLPRLVVVVDEFGELLASEGGREKMRELESITRIGRALGLHLLLVTQNFEGNLPGQIDANAGLRVSLRVQKPAHSKAVLDSGIAASIPDKLVGRAYARFHGRDLIEFQTARVAGRRRELAGDEPEVHARLAPFDTLSSAPSSGGGGDVPNEETDMYSLVGACRAAAGLTGWRKNAVPWPAALPERVSIQSLVAAVPADTPGVPIGLVDLPDEQRRMVHLLDERAEQLVVTGAGSAPIPDVLATIAASAATNASADDLHIYVIDLIGAGLGQLTALPHCGGAAIRDDQLALRMLRWLSDEVARRRTMLGTAGASTMSEFRDAGGEPPPRIMLLVSGAHRLLSTDDGPGQLLRSPLTSLMSDARGVGIQIVLGGAPKILYNRLGSGVRDRIVLELADSSDYAGVGAERGAGGELICERRAYLVPQQRVAQLGQFAPPGTGEGAIIAEIGTALPAATTRIPHRFVDLPWPLPWEALDMVRGEQPPRFVSPLPVAIDTLSGEWTWIDAVDDGPVFAVVGPPKSGRSAALAVLARLAARQGWWVINATTSRRSPLSDAVDPEVARRCAPGSLGEQIEASSGPGLVVIDDLQRLDDASAIEAATAARDRVLLAVAGPPDFFTTRNDITRVLPDVNAGVLLAPAGSLDGAAIGLRRLPAEWTSDQKPGRGILAIAGEPTEVQLPLVEVRGAAAPTQV